MQNKIAVIQIMIHYLTDKEVSIRLPTNIREVQLLELAYKKAIEWGKSINLRIIK